ncbi:hypothetical protein GUJ93_ZPchr0011g27497 [Zizania palustris]|uniref:Uncharacterized protein n=1 Tax=Zizania palustris TaxID=103762 RepID=A0A8J5WKF0_ZIZPA|nr:hypothetical protein GUJ93_ZPchr0011g27497 [Zizania palustris]
MRGKIISARRKRNNPLRFTTVHDSGPQAGPSGVAFGHRHIRQDFHVGRPLAARPQEFAEPSRAEPSLTTRRRFNAAPLTACSQLRSHRQVDLMSSGSAVASRVSCSSGNNGIFPPSLLPGFLGFPVVFALEDGFL